MNISPILLLSIGATFAFLYGTVITVGWAITRKNRKRYHNELGLCELHLYDLSQHLPLDRKIKSFSLNNNIFLAQDGEKIDMAKFDAYIVGTESPEFPKIKKGNLILIDPESHSIAYAFNIPDLSHYR